MIWIGIDPGKKGGVAAIQGAQARVIPMPITGDRVDVLALQQWLWDTGAALGEARAGVELQFIRGNQKGALTIGANFGRVLAVLELLQIQHRTVTAVSWNKWAGIRSGLQGREKKSASFAAAQQRLGSVVTELGLKPTQDGQVEALMIAAYMRGDNL